MTIEQAIFELLTSLVGGRVFPDQAPLGTVRPYIVYQQAGGHAIAYVDNTLPNSRNVRMQISLWADNRTQAAALSRQAEDLFITATAFQARPMGSAVSVFEPDTKLSGARQDFDITADRT